MASRISPSGRAFFVRLKAIFAEYVEARDKAGPTPFDNEVGDLLRSVAQGVPASVWAERWHSCACGCGKEIYFDPEHGRWMPVDIEPDTPYGGFLSPHRPMPDAPTAAEVTTWHDRPPLL